MDTKTGSRWDVVVTATLVVCAVVTTGLVIHRELLQRVPPSSERPEPIFLEYWKSYLGKGYRLGPSDASVNIIEFADFECPACARFHKDLKTLRTKYPSQISITYIHYPLPAHRFAESAAIAAECAGDQGRFEELHDQLFEQQSQIGLKSWHDFAAEAGTPDLSVFESCMREKVPLSRVMEGRQLGDEVDITGTPTVVVNGWLFFRPPSGKELQKMIESILGKKSPVNGD